MGSIYVTLSVANENSPFGKDTESNYNLCSKQLVYARLQIYTGIITNSYETECSVGAYSITEIEKFFEEVKQAEKHDTLDFSE